MKHYSVYKLLITGALVFSATNHASASASIDIAFTAGGADVTFFYDAATQSFDTVFRTKGNTVATGLSTPYGTPPGGVGGSASDFRFDTLTVEISQAPWVQVNGNGYWVSPASGSSYTDPNQPDLGIRTRLREGDPAIDQFSGLRWSLDTLASSMPSGADFVLFSTDAFGDTGSVLFETATADLSHDWPAWGHTHWHWGFSDPGDYHLVFDIQGIGGTHGDSPQGSFAVNFSVIPEPSAYAAILGGLALIALFIRRRSSQ